MGRSGRGRDKLPEASHGQLTAHTRRYAALGLLLSVVVPLIAIVPVGAARGEVTKEADAVLVRLAKFRKAVDGAEERDVFFSADMSSVANLQPLVGLTRAELVQHLGPGRVCVDRDGGQDCLLWYLYWKPFDERFLGASPVLVSTFDRMQRCTAIHIASMQ